MRSLLASGVLVAAIAIPSTASAQFGIGGRIAWVKADSKAEDVDMVRFNGGHIRLTSSRWGLELSMDRNSEEFEALNEKVTATPIQLSALLKLGGGGFAPYILGGPGWYKRKVEPIDGPDDAEVEETEFGWHGGIGLELRPHRHFGIHGDYRYTFLDFGGDDDDDDDDDGGGIIGGLLPGHRGHQWTLGATIYF